MLGCTLLKNSGLHKHNVWRWWKHRWCWRAVHCYHWPTAVGGSFRSRLLSVSSGSCPQARSESGEEGPEDPWVHLPLTPWPSCLSSHSLSSVSSGSALPYSSCPGWNWVLNRFRLSSTRRLHSLTADLSLNCPYPTPARSAQSFEPGFPWSGQVLFQTYTSVGAALEGWWRPGSPTPLRMQSHQYRLWLLWSQSRPVYGKKSRRNSLVVCSLLLSPSIKYVSGTSTEHRPWSMAALVVITVNCFQGSNITSLKLYSSPVNKYGVDFTRM